MNLDVVAKVLFHVRGLASLTHAGVAVDVNIATRYGVAVAALPAPDPFRRSRTRASVVLSNRHRLSIVWVAACPDAAYVIDV